MKIHVLQRITWTYVVFVFCFAVFSFCYDYNIISHYEKMVEKMRTQMSAVALPRDVSSDLDFILNDYIYNLKSNHWYEAFLFLLCILVILTSVEAMKYKEKLKKYQVEEVRIQSGQEFPELTQQLSELHSDKTDQAIIEEAGKRS